MYSYGDPGAFNPAVITNKEAHMIYGHWVSTCPWFSQINKRKFLPHQPVVLVKCKGKTVALTHNLQKNS